MTITDEHRKQVDAVMDAAAESVRRFAEFLESKGYPREVVALAMFTHSARQCSLHEDGDQLLGAQLALLEELQRQRRR